jgi:LysR family transcriptional regulator, transcriptional activator of nhaA
VSFILATEANLYKIKVRVNSINLKDKFGKTDMLNYKHLHYFWMAARAGGIQRAGEQLHTTPQTLSEQIKLLEERMGHALFRKRGRNLELTDAGHVAMGYADDIFSLGAELQSALSQADGAARTLEFHVGVSDSMPKTVACRLLEPALAIGLPVRLVCVEGKLRDLLSKLAVHQLDLVLADEPMPRQLSVKAFSHLLGRSNMSFFAAPKLAAKLKRKFPSSLQGAPMLIQSTACPVRPRLDQWFATHQVQPQVVGEFDDGALMKSFARQGHGVFASPAVLEDEICANYQVKVLGRSPELLEEFFAISAQRRITHPCVVAMTTAARSEIFAGQK